MLEWPTFQTEIESYDPLITLIENSSIEKIDLSDFRKITFYGSENWKKRFQKYKIIY